MKALSLAHKRQIPLRCGLGPDSKNSFQSITPSWFCYCRNAEAARVRSQTAGRVPSQLADMSPHSLSSLPLAMGRVISVHLSFSLRLSLRASHRQPAGCRRLESFVTRIPQACLHVNVAGKSTKPGTKRWGDLRAFQDIAANPVRRHCFKQRK